MVVFKQNQFTMGSTANSAELSDLTNLPGPLGSNIFEFLLIWTFLHLVLAVCAVRFSHNRRTFSAFVGGPTFKRTRMP